MSDLAGPVRILLVDDDDLSREVLELLLGAEGYEVEAASSGEDALARLRKTLSPEDLVVLSDLKMPGLCGADLAKALRDVLPLPPRILLAMSGSEPAGGTPAGYDGFLLKPFTMRQFAEALDASAKQEIVAGEPSLPLPEQGKPLDEATLVRLRAGMQPHQLEELFCFALTDAERQIEAMREAASVDDDMAYCRSAHSMKGSFGMLGAPELQALASAAEREGLTEVASRVTTLMLFSDALARLRHTLISRGVCSC